MRVITERQIEAFARFLADGERAPATVKMYVRTVKELTVWLAGREVTKELAVAWKEHLSEQSYTPATVNVKLAAVNAFFKSRGWHDIVKSADVLGYSGINTTRIYLITTGAGHARMLEWLGSVS